MSRILHGWQDLGHNVQLTEHFTPQEHTVLEMRWHHDPITVRAEESSEESSGETANKVLALLAQNAHLTASEIAQRLGLTPRTIEKQFAKLKQQGRLQRIGPNKGGYWHVIPH